MIILDSDILSLAHSAHKRVSQRLRDEPDPDIRTTVITRIELLRGRFDSVFKAATDTELVRAQELLNRTEEMLSQHSILLIDILSAQTFARLLKVKGLRKIGRGDILIASIALSRSATLATRNIKDFSLVPGLKIVNWAD